MKTKAETDEFFRRLEAERNDLSWRKPKPEVARPVEYRTPPEILAEREVWFQAGRYNAGARDTKARQGNLRAKKIARQK